MRLKADTLDDACEEMMGHTDWAYLNSLSKSDRKQISEDDIVVVFYACARPEYLANEAEEEER